MRESMRDYLQRRYRLALVGVIIGAVLMISAPGTLGVSLEIAGAIVFGSALVIAARTRCPRCHKPLDPRVIAALVQFSHAPPKRCPRCGVDLDTPYPSGPG